MKCPIGFLFCFQNTNEIGISEHAYGYLFHLCTIYIFVQNCFSLFFSNRKCKGFLFTPGPSLVFLAFFQDASAYTIRPKGRPQMVRFKLYLTQQAILSRSKNWDNKQPLVPFCVCETQKRQCKGFFISSMKKSMAQNYLYCLIGKKYTCIIGVIRQLAQFCPMMRPYFFFKQTIIQHFLFSSL